MLFVLCKACIYSRIYYINSDSCWLYKSTAPPHEIWHCNNQSKTITIITMQLVTQLNVNWTFARQLNTVVIYMLVFRLVKCPGQGSRTVPPPPIVNACHRMGWLPTDIIHSLALLCPGQLSLLPHPLSQPWSRYLCHKSLPAGDTIIQILPPGNLFS